MFNLSTIQLGIAAGACAVALSFGSIGGYKLGAAFQAKEDSKALQAGIDAANAAADAAKAQQVAQAAQYKIEIDNRDKRDALATQLYNDLQSETNKTAAQLSSARKALKELRNDPATAASLDTRIPDAVRVRVCAELQASCH